MAEFIYTTSSALGGPWLIDGEKLETLDHIIDEEWSRIVTRNQTLLRKEVEDRLKADEYGITDLISGEKDPTERETKLQARREQIESRIRVYGFREERSITIYLKDNKKIIVDSFGEALRQQSLLHETPIGFEVALKSGEINGKLELSRNGFLFVTVSPEHLTESREMFAALQRWATMNRAPKWQQLWMWLNPLQWGLWIIILLLVLVLLVGDSSSKAFYKEQARQLLQDGVRAI